MHVRLVDYTDIRAAYAAGKTCVADYNYEEPSLEEMNSFFSMLIKKGHESVLEHIVFVFEIGGISRALLQELVRHRIASYSVESTRWSLKNVLNDPGMMLDFERIADEAIVDGSVKELSQKVYSLMGSIKKYADAGEKNDVLKLFLPECFTTCLTLTINARSLRNMFKLRTVDAAFWEFKDLCIEMFREVPCYLSEMLFHDIFAFEDEA
jgi:thymidylate synthase (FAD)